MHMRIDWFVCYFMCKRTPRNTNGQHTGIHRVDTMHVWDHKSIYHSPFLMHHIPTVAHFFLFLSPHSLSLFAHCVAIMFLAREFHIIHNLLLENALYWYAHTHIHRTLFTASTYHSVSQLMVFASKNTFIVRIAMQKWHSCLDYNNFFSLQEDSTTKKKLKWKACPHVVYIDCCTTNRKSTSYYFFSALFFCVGKSPSSHSLRVTCMQNLVRASRKFSSTESE